MLLIRTLVDRTFKINNLLDRLPQQHYGTYQHCTIGKYQVPSSLVNRTVKQYLRNFFAPTLRASVATNSHEIRTHYYKLPFVCPFSTYAQHRVKRLTPCYCNNLVIKLVFALYKIKKLFSVKDAISNLSRSRVVYKFSCAGYTCS